ncbi:hypothetical protein ACMZOO_17390 [Catenovulum sp. SX2]|uniref:hypothetical protein n=1 Tax=Catenovulum sp. SX2 TaxID=3398614 RepID=UPI003F87E073
MELNKLSFEPCPRTPSQVFDLTLLFVKKHFVALIKIYLTLVVPLAAIFYALLPIEYVGFIIWWLKPVFERPLLTYLSRVSFSYSCSTFEAISSLKQLKIINIIKLLTIYRLSTTRAYNAPIEQLEKQSSKALTKRKDILNNRCSHNQTWWILLCVHLEMLMLMTLLFVYYGLFPDFMPIDEHLTFEYFNSSEFVSLYLITYLMSIALIAPYFTTGGFLMYLNSRIHIEGWDIEQSFKRIVARLSQVSLIAILSVNLFFPHPVSANDSIEDKIELLEVELNQKSKEAETEIYQRPESLDKIYQEVVSIYKDEKLVETQTTYVPKSQEDPNFDLTWLKKLFKIFSGLSELSPIIAFVFWALVILLCGWVVVSLIKLFKKTKSWTLSRNKTTEQTNSVQEFPSFIRNQVSQDWPDDLIAASLEALEKANLRYALALILRHTLIQVHLKHPDIFNKSMTEFECKSALIRVTPQPQHTFYDKLFSLWIQQAWAHKDVSIQEIQLLITEVSSFTVSVERQNEK